MPEVEPEILQSFCDLIEDDERIAPLRQRVRDLEVETNRQRDYIERLLRIIENLSLRTGTTCSN